jgi:peptidoglycan/xylan/chitin deacetylase (PgdA/CDA1 family)
VLQTFKDRWVPRICRTVPLRAWHRVCRTNLIVPHWHVVSDQELPHVSGVYQFRSIRQFEADVEFLLRHYAPVTEQDVVSHLHGGRALPPRCVLLTFDDGFREIHDVVAPLLRAKGVPAVFFLITSAVDNRSLCYPQKQSLLIDALARRQGAATLEEVGRLLSVAGVASLSNLALRIRTISYAQRSVLDNLGRVLGCAFEEYLASRKPYVTSEQVQSLIRQGFSIGAHSVDHPPYAHVSLDEQLFQTRESMRWLSERFHLSCQSFAFPYRDDGVSLDFFRTMFAGDGLKVSFGTGGLVPHAFPCNLPRFSTERTDLSASEVLAGQFARYLVRGRFSSNRGV